VEECVIYLDRSKRVPPQVKAGPARIELTPPMECLAVDRLPEGDEWVYELKLDGYSA
jgi:hypothetical protein